MKDLKGVIFDLDGVIADTARFHFDAWQQIAKELSIDIDIEFNEQLKGIDRRNSMEKILEYGKVDLSETQIKSYMEKKNIVYLELLQKLTPKDILPGIESLVSQLAEQNNKIAIASASKNAQHILDKLGLIEYIDYIADPLLIKNPKPAPDIFLDAAIGIGCDVCDCVAIEDSIAGIKAIKAAGIKCVSIGLNDVKVDLKLEKTEDLKLRDLEQLINS